MIYVLYHANCVDGFGAAFAAWKKFKDQAQYIPVTYGQSFPLMKTNSEVYIVDFSYPRAQLLNLVQSMSKVVVLDHHKTAQEDLKGLDFAKFDMKKSGAMLAWEYFHPETKVPKLIEYIQDRDLWNNILPQTKEFNLGLSAYSFDFELWDKIDENTLVAEGITIERYQEQKIQEMLREVKFINFAGYKSIPVLNCSVLQSDVVNKMLDKYPQAPFALGYHDLKSGKRKWSARSRQSEDVDVTIIAAKFGGGGHKNAAGFTTDLNYLGEESE